MVDRSRALAILLVLLVTALGLASCGATTAAVTPAAPAATEPVTQVTAAPPEPAAEPATAEPAYPPVRVLTSFAIDSMDPVSEGFWFTEFGVGELLMKMDSSFRPTPHLLQSLEQIDDLNWRLILRANITFQNGKPLDGEALAALMQYCLEKSSGAQADLPGASVTATGDLEVVLTTSGPTPTVPNILANEADFPVYDVEAVKAVGEDYAKLVGAGIWTGPYQVVSLDDEQLVAERYDGYWQGVPPLAGVTVGFVADAQARILAVQNGEADIALYVPSEAKTLLEGRTDAYFATAAMSRGGFRVVLNMRTAPFDDVRVRQALGHAIDYDAMANDVLNGVYEVARGFYPSNFAFALENQVHDTEKASKLLDEAGWEMGADGIRTKDGQPLHVVVLIYPQQPDLEPISVAMQAELREVGFDVEIQSLDDIGNIMLKDLSPWNVGLLGSGPIGGGGGPNLHRYEYSKGDRNYGSIIDAELDAIIEELAVTFDEAERTELLQAAQRIIVEEQAYEFFIANKLFPAVVSPAYRDYVPSPNWLHVTFETKPSGS